MVIYLTQNSQSRCILLFNALFAAAME